MLGGKSGVLAAGVPGLPRSQVQLTNLQAMYERGKATSDQRRQLELEYQDWARLQGRGPHTAGGHGRNRHVGWQEQ